MFATENTIRPAGNGYIVVETILLVRLSFFTVIQYILNSYHVKYFRKNNFKDYNDAV